MKAVGVTALKENPNILSQCAAEGEYVLVTSKNQAMAVSVPFDERLFEAGVHVQMAITLYQQGVLTLVKAAKLAKLPVETFLMQLNTLGVVVVEQTADELAADLQALGLV